MFSEPMPKLDEHLFGPTISHTPDSELTPNRGILGWWYRIAAPRIDSPRPSLVEREHLRRGRLAAALILAIFALGIIYVPFAINTMINSGAINTYEIYGLLVGVAGCGLALALNRAGAVGAASVLLTALLELGIIGGILVSMGSLNISNLMLAPHILLMPLLVIPELIAASLLAPWSVFVVATLNCVFVTLVVVFWAGDKFILDVLNDPRVAHALSLFIAPQMTLFLIVALVSYLWVRSATRALIARDRAEELASLEHAVAEERRNLELGIQRMHDTLVRVANGDFTARTPMDHNNVLWQLSAALNTMIARQQKVSDAQYQLQRASAEVTRLTQAVHQARLGRPPIWPAETGALTDPLIRELKGSGQQDPTLSCAPPSLAGRGIMPNIYGSPIPGVAPYFPLGPNPQYPAPSQLPPISQPPNPQFSIAPQQPPISQPPYPPERGASSPRIAPRTTPRYPNRGYPTNPQLPVLDPNGELPEQPYPDLGELPAKP